MSRSTRSSRSGSSGFTLIEVVVALAVVAISLAAIGSLIATTVRGVRAIDRRLSLVETTRAVVTGLPNRDELAPGSLAGELAGHRWRVDVLPFPVSEPDGPTSTWVPQNVVVRVQSATGSILQINTIRLRRRPAQ